MIKLEKFYAGQNIQEEIGRHHINLNGYFEGVFIPSWVDRKDQAKLTIISIIIELNKLALLNNINVRFKIESGVERGL